MSLLFEPIYNGNPLLPELAGARHGLERNAAERFVRRAGREHDTSIQEIGPTDADTLGSLRQKLKFIDAIANTALHATTVEKIDAIYRNQASHVAEQLDMPQDAAVDLLEHVSRYGAIEPNAAKDFILGVPYVEGFGDSSDTALEDNEVEAWLRDSFGIALLLSSKTFGVTKSDEYLLKATPYMGTSVAKAVDKARKQGLISSELRGLYVVPTRLAYTQFAALLEGRESDRIEHLYRNRAVEADFKPTDHLFLGNHSIEDVSAFDYTSGLDDLSEQQLRDLYILGTLTHEIAHKLLFIGNIDFDTYKAVVDTELHPDQGKGVTDYTREYIENQRNPENIGDVFYAEDFAETMRIYVSNAAYLQRHFPGRYALITNSFPTIDPNSALSLIRTKQ